MKEVQKACELIKRFTLRILRTQHLLYLYPSSLFKYCEVKHITCCTHRQKILVQFVKIASYQTPIMTRAIELVWLKKQLGNIWSGQIADNFRPSMSGCSIFENCTDSAYWISRWMLRYWNTVMYWTDSDSLACSKYWTKLIIS